jgi:hypothetical protein
LYLGFAKQVNWPVRAAVLSQVKTTLQQFRLLWEQQVLRQQFLLQ